MRPGQLLLAGMAGVVLVSSAQAEQMVALTPSNSLLRFDSATPGATTSIPVTGLSSGETLLGIDQRPIDAQLFGVTSASRVYSINLLTGLATPRGAAFTPALGGARFGIDFNPTVDRIRYVDAAAKNRRFNPATGALAADDADLTFASGGPSGSPRTVGVAYTNSQLGGVPAGSVRELAIDSQRDLLIEIGTMAGGNASFNAGVATVIGNLNVDTTDDVGFDISGATGIYYASLTTATGGSMLYTLNSATGNATPLGAFASPVSDIAVLVPEPASLSLVAAASLVTLRRRR
jgi:hypothetical protein